MEILANSIGVFERTFDANFCRQLIADAKDKVVPVIEKTRWENQEHSIDGVDVRNNNKRKDVSFLFERFGSFERYIEAFNQVLTARSDEYFNFFGKKHGCTSESYSWTPLNQRSHKLQHTPPGGGFNRPHVEQGPGVIDCASRYAVWMVYLNDLTEEEGGATEFPAQGITLQPKEGTLVIWPAGYTHPHNGTPPKEDKWIVTGWMFYDPYMERNPDAT